MYREERRNLEKNGVSKETIEKLNQYDKPCTILEVVKLSKAVAEDVVSTSIEDYRRKSAGTIIALTLQVELFKKILIEKGLETEESLQSRYETEAKIFEDKQREYLESLNQTSREEESSVINMSSLKNTNLEVDIERN